MPEYVVQIKVDDGGPNGVDARWEDVGVVNAAPKTKRRQVIRQALLGAGLADQQKTFVVRVLDEESAATTPVRFAQREPELEIG
jgi:hypothetical protein